MQENIKKMKNKYIQTKFGHCVNYCLANLFNNKKFIRPEYLNEKGMSGMRKRRLVEKVTNYTTRDLFKSPWKRIEVEVPLFEQDQKRVEGLKIDKYHYMPFIIGVDSKIHKGYRHAVLGFQEWEGEWIHILDPREKDSFSVRVDSIFTELKPYSATTLMNMEGNMPLFTNDEVSHLL